MTQRRADDVGAVTGPSRLVAGPMVASVEVTVAALVQSGDLAGDQFAGTRQALVEAALAVDTARTQLESGKGNVWTYVNAARMMHAALLDVRKGVGRDGDPVDDLIASIVSTPTVRD